MDFFDHRCFRLNKLMTTFIGQWPYLSKKKTIAISFFYLMMNTSLALVTINGLITLELNFDEILNNITIIMTNWGVGVKLVNSVSKKKKMKHLLEEIKSNWTAFSKTELDVMIESSDKGKYLIVAYAVLVYSTMTLFLMTSYTPQFLDIIKPLNESRPKRRVYKSNYFVNDETYFYPLLFHEQFTVFLNMTTVICVDTMYVKYVEQICGIFTVLRYRMENVIKNADLEFFEGYTSGKEEQIIKEVSMCIAFHRKAIKYAKCIESIYGLSLCLQLTFSMLLLSATGYVTAIKLETLNEFLQVAPFALGQIVHYFYNSLPGQQLINHSEEIGHSVKNMQWYRMPVKAQKLLILLMLRSFERPCTITACGIFTLSMETFSTGMKTSFSYFTVLMSMRE